MNNQSDSQLYQTINVNEDESYLQLDYVLHMIQSHKCKPTTGDPLPLFDFTPASQGDSLGPLDFLGEASILSSHGTLDYDELCQ